MATGSHQVVLGNEPGALASLKVKRWGYWGNTVESTAFWSVVLGAQCQDLHIKEQLLSFNGYYFQFFLSGRKETGFYYVLNTYDFFIDSIILTQQQSKLRLKEVTLAVSQVSRAGIWSKTCYTLCTSAHPWIAILWCVNLGFISAECLQTSGLRPLASFLLRGRVGVRD